MRRTDVGPETPRPEWTPQERPCPCCKGPTIWTYERLGSLTMFVRSCVDQVNCRYRTSHTMNVTASTA